MAYKKYGENLRPTGAREVFFPNYLRLIRLVQKRGAGRCMRNKYVVREGVLRFIELKTCRRIKIKNVV